MQTTSNSRRCRCDYKYRTVIYGQPSSTCCPTCVGFVESMASAEVLSKEAELVASETSTPPTYRRVEQLTYIPGRGYQKVSKLAQRMPAMNGYVLLTVQYKILTAVL